MSADWCVNSWQAQTDLNLDASAVSEISLNHAVRQAISASNAKYDDEDVVDRVRARKNKAVAGAKYTREGWKQDHNLHVHVVKKACMFVIVRYLVVDFLP